jgi:hypothetical protein
VGKPVDGANDPKAMLKWVKYQVEVSQAIQLLFQHMLETKRDGIGPMADKARDMLRQAGVKVASPDWFAKLLYWE